MNDNLQHNQNIKDILYNIIADMSANKDKYVRNPDKDFTRDRKLPFDTVLKTVLSMKGGSLKKELYECLGRDPEKLATSSAFLRFASAFFKSCDSDTIIFVASDKDKSIAQTGATNTPEQITANTNIGFNLSII